MFGEQSTENISHLTHKQHIWSLQVSTAHHCSFSKCNWTVLLTMHRSAALSTHPLCPPQKLRCGPTAPITNERLNTVYDHRILSPAGSIGWLKTLYRPIKATVSIMAQLEITLFHVARCWPRLARLGSFFACCPSTPTAVTVFCFVLPLPGLIKSDHKECSTLVSSLRDHLSLMFCFHRRSSPAHYHLRLSLSRFFFHKA